MPDYLIATRNIIPYLIIFSLFRWIFSKITSYYIKDLTITPHPIDVHAFVTKRYADTQYIIDAKNSGYDHARYFKSFLPLDLLYPLFYSLLFLSCLLYCSSPLLIHLFTVLIVTGAVLDWAEDISFSVFLSSTGNQLAAVVAFFTTIKTIVFILNLLICLFWLMVAVKSIIFKSN